MNIVNQEVVKNQPPKALIALCREYCFVYERITLLESLPLVYWQADCANELRELREREHELLADIRGYLALGGNRG